MPTPLLPGEKQAFIALASIAPFPGGAGEADRLQSVLNYYSDVYTAFMRQLDLFATNTQYLKQAISCFTDANLQAVGIFNNKQVTSPTMVNPVLLINSNYSFVDISENSPPSSPPFQPALTLLGNSYIGRLTVHAYTGISELYIGPGSTVDVADASQILGSPPISARINKIYLPYMRSNPSKLNAVTYESQIGQVIIEDGSYYGGIQSYDPKAICNEPVANVVVTETTKNGFLVSWTLPAIGSPPSSNSYLFINIFFRKSSSHPWIQVNQGIEYDGDYVGDTGFIFRCLDSDTFYDIKIQTVCQNGGRANVITTFQTVCCGAGTVMNQYLDDTIRVLIKTSPNPATTQTLRNGTVLPKEYPVGATITIPYLAGKYVFPDILIDNVNYQDFPFNDATGVFDATTTPLGAFIDGNVVSIGSSIPAQNSISE